MLKLTLRGVGFLQRLIVGFSNFGFWGAIKLFIVYRSRSLQEPTSIYIRKLRRTFYFRGAADRGVMSHFYKEGYRIKDDQSSAKIRFIVDAGANIGDETLRFRFFYPDARIIAIEAEANNYRLLQKNVQGDSNCFPLNRGLWSRVCRLKVIPGTVNENFRVIEVDETAKDHDILATSVAQIMREYSAPEIDILKLDIEGAERQVFNAATNSWLTKVKVFIFECPDHDAPGTTMLIFEKLLQAGAKFNCYLHGENVILIRQDVDWKVASDLFLEK